MKFSNNHINYIEFKTNNIERCEEFYSKTFHWSFTDYGPTYTSFAESGVHGGFEKSDSEIVNGALVVLYHQNLDEIKSEILKHGGKIILDIFTFPGGKRFHFKDPSGNELAVWSE